MMRAKQLGLLVLSLLICSLVFAASADYDKFPFGVYSLLQNGNKYFGPNRAKIAEYMKKLGYNFTVMQTNNSETDLDGLLAVLAENGVDAVLSDKSWSNEATDSRHYAMLALSTSNFQRFEAEFSDASPVKADDINMSKYWYGSVVGNNNQHVPRRTGAKATDAQASYGNSWLCVKNRDKAGYAITDLTYRWKDNRGNSVKYSDEFRIHKTHQKTEKDVDSLYVKFRIKIGNLNSKSRENEVLFSLSPMGYLGKATAFADSASIKHRFGKTQGVTSNFTIQDYMEMGQPKGYFDLEISMSYNDLRECGVMSDDFDLNPATEGSWWWYYLQGFSPRLYWYGNCDLSVDYLEIEDQIHRNLRTQPDTYRAGINKRLRELISLPHGNIIRNFYPMDEPYQTQLNSFRELNAVIDDDLPKMFTASYDIKHKEFKMGDDKSYFDQVELVKEVAEPNIITPDIYPIKPGINFNPGSPNFIQTVFDEKLLKVYSECKAYSLEKEGRKFMPIVQTFGRWNGKEWVSWLLPPKATQKAMLYLPLCYGPDGLISYLLAGLLNRKGEGDYAQFLAYDMDPITTDTPTWDVVSELNPRLKFYGALIQDWKWLTAGTIQLEDTAVPQELTAKGITGLKVLKSGKGDYEGYIQCGYYQDIAGDPAIFAVNRRTDFFKVGGEKKNGDNLAPSDYKNYYAEFEPQNLVINTQRGAWGSFPAVFDPLDSFMTIGEQDKITVSLPAGEAKMLKLASSLPSVVKKGNYDMKGYAILKGNIQLNKKANVICYGDLYLSDNCNLVLAKKSTLTVKGKLIQAPGAKIESMGRLIITGE